MASNSIGDILKLTTFGESHGLMVGAILDGCPAGIDISTEEVQFEVNRRKSGISTYTSPRIEQDLVQIVSGIYEGKTTGAPIAIIIENKGFESSPYIANQNLLRPGHANFTYLSKYGYFDPRGGGRSSARETVVRVAAGAIAKKIYPGTIHAFISSIGEIRADPGPFLTLEDRLKKSEIFCPDFESEKEMKNLLDLLIVEGDSIGAVVGCHAMIPPNLGDPIYGKLEAKLASALLSIPATRGIEFEEGFLLAKAKGSQSTHPFLNVNGGTKPYTKAAILGGISTGSLLEIRLAFKPASSIKMPIETLDMNGQPSTYTTPKEGKHDPCVAIRAVPVVEAMVHLVLADCYLSQKSKRHQAFV
jgi:chorismate synthase